MSGPVTLPANATLRRCYRNIVQVVDAPRNGVAGLELQSCQAACRLDMEGEGTKARNRVEILINRYAVKRARNPLSGGGPGLGEKG
jgi:hypothetical protein